jgi:hypothetical protein
LSGLTGLAGFTNGEIARTAGPRLTLYRARLFLRQTWGLGGGRSSLNRMPISWPEQSISGGWYGR